MDQNFKDELNKLLTETQEAIDSFDNQVELVGSCPFPIELYELLCKLHAAVDVLTEDATEDASRSKYQQAAINELTERLSDSVSNNIELSVQLRVKRDEEVAAANQAAADAFLDEAIANLFNPRTTDPTNDQGARA